MRLLEADETGRVTLTQDFLDEDIPRPYAILSHTWGDKEVTLQDLQAKDVRERPEYTKIRFCTQQARRDGIRYFWIDSCCIDKTNSVELSRAINSMFRWYAKADICYVYLADVRSKKAEAEGHWQDDFRRSRWFTRGWTLQELLAPKNVRFFSRDGLELGDKTSLESLIRDITGIPARALRGSPFSSFTRQERFAWQQGRQTKVPEDISYSLLGIFDVSLPVIYGEGGDQARRRLEREIDIATKGSDHQDYSVPFSLGNAVETAHFVSREQEIEDMLRTLAGDGVRRLVVIQGLGGIGKTQLAIAYAMRHRDKYSAIVWVNIKDEVSARQSFATIARQISRAHPSAREFQQDDESNQNADSVESVRAWLSREHNTRWLMIFDNYDNPKVPGNTGANAVDHRKFFPEAHQGSIIITSRSSEVYPDNSIRLRKLQDVQDGLNILTSASGRRHLSEDFDAIQLAKRLDGLPLALATAGAYLRQSSISFADYLRLYESSWAKLQKTSPGLITYEDRTLYSTWQISYLQIEERSYLAANLLRLWAYFDNNDLWYELLNHATYSFPDWFQNLTKDELDFHDAMRVLYDHGVVEVNPTEQDVVESAGYSIHTCVHSWTKTVLNLGLSEELAQIALICVTSHLPERYASNRAAINRRISNHASQMVSFERVGFRTARACHNIADFLAQQGSFNEAEKLFRRVLAVWEFYPEPTKSEIDTLNMLGFVYRKQERLQEAQATYDQALKVAEIFHAEDHERIAFLISNLATVYLHQGKFDEAEATYLRTIRIQEALFGETSLVTLEAVGTLGTLYKKQDRLEAASAMYQRVLDGREAALGKLHDDTLDIAFEMGRLYEQRGKLQQAETMFLRVLHGREAYFRGERATIGDVLHCLGALYVRLGKVDQAVSLLKRALTIRAKVLGGQDPNTLYTASLLDRACDGLEDHENAEKLFRRVFEALQGVYGRSHSRTLHAALQICVVLGLRGKVDEAWAAYENAVDDYHAITWDRDAIFQEYKLGVIFIRSRKIEEAQKIMERAVQGYESTYGKDHIDTLEVNTRLGAIFVMQGQLDQGEQAYQLALRSYDRLTPDVQLLVDDLGRGLQAYRTDHGEPDSQMPAGASWQRLFQLCFGKRRRRVEGD